MSAFFTQFFVDYLSANPTAMASAVLKLVLFREAPTFETNDAGYTGITTKADLLAKPGWLESQGTGYPLTNTLTVGVQVSGANNYVMFNQFPFTGMAAAEAVAVGIQLSGTYSGKVDPIIFVSNTPFGTRRVVSNGDGLTAFNDSNLAGASKKWLFSWAAPPGSSTQIVSMVEGPLALFLGAPTFEPSHSQHVWLYPQRANMIANPSFEAPGTNFWASNGTKTRDAITTPLLGAGAYEGKFVKAGTVIAESNVFPTQYQENWTVQFRAKGSGKIKVGFVYWEDNFLETATDWGEDTETWTLNPNSYVHVVICRTAPQAYQGMLRIECDGGTMSLDQVLVEAGFLKDWPYFDGDSTYGARDDFSWYGGAARSGASYSLWYNNKRVLYGHMFSRTVEDGTLITDEVMREQGYIYNWVPAGTFVVPHMDVFYPFDIQSPVPTKSATVIPYRVDPDTDLLGVLDPWT